jgi:hypothetical protein
LAKEADTRILAPSIRLGPASSFLSYKTHKTNGLCAASSKARYFGNMKNCF